VAEILEKTSALLSTVDGAATPFSKP